MNYPGDAGPKLRPIRFRKGKKAQKKYFVPYLKMTPKELKLARRWIRAHNARLDEIETNFQNN